MPKKPPKDNPQCPICSNIAVKNGTRKIKFRNYPRYLCRQCSHSFTAQPALQQSKTYSLKTILSAISDYNLGRPLRSLPIPKSTIHNWKKALNLPMHRLRKDITTNPIIKHRFIHHLQPFLYQYHSLKLEFAKKFPGLINYLKTVHTSLPKDIFSSSERISAISKEKNETNKIIEGKDNYAVKLAKLASAITKDNRQRHNIIENFMLINDTATIAAEIPVYLKKEESGQNRNLTGHIDILQLRFHKLYILDYKPEPLNKHQAITQLFLYRKALSKRTSLPEHKFRLAFFNNKGYYGTD